MPNRSGAEDVDYQFNKCIHNHIDGMFTSRTEIGSINETYVYVRFPYHLAIQIECIAEIVSESRVGTHHFKAPVMFQGMKPLSKTKAPVSQWPIHIAGQKGSRYHPG